MKNVFYAIVMFICLVMPSRAWAETFVLGVLEDLPPFEYRENGELKGIDLEIGNEIAKRLGIEFKYQGLPWTRIKKYAEDGTDIHGILSMFRLEKYLPIVDFTEDTFRSKISFFVTKESTMHISGLEDLRGKKVGVIRGYTYTPEFDAYKQMERMMFDSNDVLAKVLDRNRVEVVVAEEVPFLFTAKRTGFPDRFRAVYTLDENPTCMAFSKKALGEKSRIMADRVSWVIRKMKDEGVIRNILDNYIK